VLTQGVGNVKLIDYIIKNKDKDKDKDKTKTETALP
jgi:hypothetical protein